MHISSSLLISPRRQLRVPATGHMSGLNATVSLGAYEEPSTYSKICGMYWRGGSAWTTCCSGTGTLHLSQHTDVKPWTSVTQALKHRQMDSWGLVLNHI